MSAPLKEQPLKFNTMTLIGQGRVSSVPDIAKVRLGVQTNGEDLEFVQAENARISEAILQTLNQIGVSDIKTFQYNIDKDYIYENGTRLDNGYTVRNIVEITLNNIDQVGMVIDTAVEAGANVVEFITFEMSEPDFYYQQALNLAVIDAIQKAKSISRLLGLKLEPFPNRIVENSSSQIPFTQSRAISERSFATPIEPGHYQTEANVTVDFIY